MPQDIKKLIAKEVKKELKKYGVCGSNYIMINRRFHTLEGRIEKLGEVIANLGINQKL